MNSKTYHDDQESTALSKEGLEGAGEPDCYGSRSHVDDTPLPLQGHLDSTPPPLDSINYLH